MPIISNSAAISNASALTHGSVSIAPSPSTQGSAQGPASPFDQILQAFVQSQLISLSANSSETTASNAELPAIPSFTSDPDSIKHGSDQLAKGLPSSPSAAPTADTTQADIPALVLNVQSTAADPTQISPIEVVPASHLLSTSKALAPTNGSPVNSIALQQAGGGRRTSIQKAALLSTQSVDANPAAASAAFSAVMPFPVPAPLPAQQPVVNYASQSLTANSSLDQIPQDIIPSVQTTPAASTPASPVTTTDTPASVPSSPLPEDSESPILSGPVSTISKTGVQVNEGLQSPVMNAGVAFAFPQNWTNSSQLASARSATAAFSSNASNGSDTQENSVSQIAAGQNTNVMSVPSSPDTAAVLQQIAALKATLTAPPRITSGPQPVVTPKSTVGDSAAAAQLPLTGAISSDAVAPKALAPEFAPGNLPQSQAADLPAIQAGSSGTQKDTGSPSSNPGGHKSRAETLTVDPPASATEPVTFAQSVGASTLPPSPDSTSAVSPVQTVSANSAAAAPTQVLTHQSGTEPELSGALLAWNAGDNAQARSMQMANIARNPAPSEMNIALQADSLGNVQLRARISGDQVGAAILVDRHDVHAALASDLPALHQALTERQFRVENVSLSQGPIHSGNSGNAGGDDGRQTQQRNSNGQNGYINSRWAGENSAASFDAVPGAPIPDVNVIFDSNGRLSVRA